MGPKHLRAEVTAARRGGMTISADGEPVIAAQLTDLQNDHDVRADIRVAKHGGGMKEKVIGFLSSHGRSPPAKTGAQPCQRAVRPPMKQSSQPSFSE